MSNILQGRIFKRTSPPRLSAAGEALPLIGEYNLKESNT